MSPAVTALYTYPLKSAQGIALARQAVGPDGLAFDRRLALLGPDDEVLTAREHPTLLALRISLGDGVLHVARPDGTRLDLPVERDDPTAACSALTVHGADAFGRSVGRLADAWFSEYLGAPCRAVRVDDSRPREVLLDHGGRPGDRVGFADRCPILLTCEASLDDLNARLERPVPMSQFRPNVVVGDAPAYAEDAWRRIRIGAVSFEVVEPCARCVLATIDPDTGIRHPDQEPLRTLARYHRVPGGAAGFGVYLIPRGAGAIGIRDEVLFD